MSVVESVAICRVPSVSRFHRLCGSRLRGRPVVIWRGSRILHSCEERERSLWKDSKGLALTKGVVKTVPIWGASLTTGFATGYRDTPQIGTLLTTLG
jgi:hypothetical protein